MASMITDKSTMSTDTQTALWAHMLERNERSRTGGSVATVRAAIAQRLGVAPGTLENISRGRLKGVRAWVAEKIRGAVIRELEREIQRLQGELHMAHQSGAHPAADEVCAALSAIAEARHLIRDASN